MEFDNSSEFSKEELVKLQGYLSSSIEALTSKVKLLIDRINQVNEENFLLKETIKDLNNKITDLKLQLNKLNSDTIFKDKEISNLKNLLINLENSNTNIRDKEIVRSKLKELISRIDVHLEQYDEGDNSYGDN